MPVFIKGRESGGTTPGSAEAPSALSLQEAKRNLRRPGHLSSPFHGRFMTRPDANAAKGARMVRVGLWALLAALGLLLWSRCLATGDGARPAQALLVNYLYFVPLAAGLCAWSACLTLSKALWAGRLETLLLKGPGFALPSIIALVGLLALGRHIGLGSAGLSSGTWFAPAFLFGRDAAALILFWAVAAVYSRRRRERQWGANGRRALYSFRGGIFACRDRWGNVPHRSLEEHGLWPVFRGIRFVCRHCCMDLALRLQPAYDKKSIARPGEDPGGYEPPDRLSHGRPDIDHMVYQPSRRDRLHPRSHSHGSLANGGHYPCRIGLPRSPRAPASRMAQAEPRFLGRGRFTGPVRHVARTVLAGCSGIVHGSGHRHPEIAMTGAFVGALGIAFELTRPTSAALPKSRRVPLPAGGFGFMTEAERSTNSGGSFRRRAAIWSLVGLAVIAVGLMAYDLLLSLATGARAALALQSPGACTRQEDILFPVSRRCAEFGARRCAGGRDVHAVPCKNHHRLPAGQPFAGALFRFGFDRLGSRDTAAGLCLFQPCDAYPAGHRLCQMSR